MTNRGDVRRIRVRSQGSWALPAALGATAGLIAGWIMTFLDTVDGKLARVTVQSSRFGHYLDHGMDIVHPPFWYWLWGLGLAVPPALWGFDAATLYSALFAGYIGGRVAEGLFGLLGKLEVFTWRPFDAYFRLVTARRNTCMIFLTVFAVVGQPELAFLSVVLWTVGTTLVLCFRLFQAMVLRLKNGPLVSWMEDPEAAAEAYPTTFRGFSATRSAYLYEGGSEGGSEGGKEEGFESGHGKGDG